MRVLVTTSRMPFAVDEIRKLGEAGFTVFAADTFSTAPGGHSRHVSKNFVVPSPRRQTARFVDAIATIALAHRIDLIIPAFEEVLYLAQHRATLPSSTTLFAPSFQALRHLHDKVAFTDLVNQLALPTPKSIVVRNQVELRRAISEHDLYFARPAFSRGGMSLLTNTGPLRGAMEIEECHPNQEIPWLVQEFVDGEEICTWSAAHSGKLVAHVTYAHPHTVDKGGGVTFRSLDSATTFEVARRLAAHTDYTGQFGLDFLRHHERGQERVMVTECNPRATAGASLLSPDEFAQALQNTSATAFVCPSGRRRQIASGLLLDMLRNWRHIPEDFLAMFTSGSDIYAQPDDLLPGLYQFLSYSHVLEYQRQMPNEATYDLRDVVRSQFYDVSWSPEAPQ